MAVRLPALSHYKDVFLDQFLVTRVDTEVVIAVCGEEHLAHPRASPAEENDGDVDWSSGVAQEAQRRRASLASFAWLD